MTPRAIVASPLVCSILEAWPGSAVTINGKPIMTDPTPHEIDALLAASPAGGEYLEKLGKTDLAVLTEDEWMGFIEAVVTAFQDRMAQLHAPFAVNCSSDDPFRITAADCPY